jgi:hypothetical protein
MQVSKDKGPWTCLATIANKKATTSITKIIVSSSYMRQMRLIENSRVGTSHSQTEKKSGKRWRPQRAQRAASSAQQSTRALAASHAEQSTFIYGPAAGTGADRTTHRLRGSPAALHACRGGLVAAASASSAQFPSQSPFASPDLAWIPTRFPSTPRADPSPPARRARRDPIEVQERGGGALPAACMLPSSLRPAWPRCRWTPSRACTASWGGRSSRRHAGDPARGSGGRAGGARCCG